MKKLRIETESIFVQLDAPVNLQEVKPQDNF